MSSPAVCVGIVTRNRAESLSKAIASVVSQQGVNARIVVLDDGSTDQTSTLEEKFPEVIWIRRKKSGGYISARNELMARFNAAYFVSLDDDAWFLQGDEIGIAIEFLENNPSAAAIALDILSSDRPQLEARTAPCPVAMFIGCGHVLRLSAVRQVGGYEETPGAYGVEEKDLSLRLIDAGYEIVRLNGVHVWHEKSVAARDLYAQHRSGVCNDLVMTVHRAPLMLLPIALLSKFYRHTVFAIRNHLVGPALAGFLLFSRALPNTWRSRKPVKASALRKFMQLRA